MQQLQLMADLPIGQSLTRSGYWRGQLPEALFPLDALLELQKASDDLPADVYAPRANRFRTLNRFSVEVVDPSVALLEQNFESGSYVQSDRYNPELGGISRRYA